MRARCLFVLISALTLLSARAQPPEPRTVRISVLSLFHPRVLTLRTSESIFLDAAPVSTVPGTLVHIQSEDANRLQLDLPELDRPELAGPARTLTASTLTLPPSVFTLTIPGKLTRAYRGTLILTVREHILRITVVMPPELAVASIVQAESPPHAGLEALKAQAVAARSFLLANLHAHASRDSDPDLDADACDTTHCQFLRTPPARESLAALATRTTTGLVLTWQPDASSPPRLVPAMYSRSCGGHTRARTSPASGDYPFYPVACAFCLRHPELWSRPILPESPPASEKARLAWNRTHGWSAIPSLSGTQTASGLEGRGIGHGIGLCQLGAADLAARGQTFDRILAHFYPNTQLTRLPQP